MAYLDGEITGERADSISTHIESCRECRQTSATFRSLSQQINSWQLGSASAGFEQRLQERITNAAIAVSRKAGFLRLLPRRRASRWVLGLASAALAGILLLSTLTLLRQSMTSYYFPPGGPSPGGLPRGVDSFVINGNPLAGKGTIGKLQQRGESEELVQQPMIARTAILNIVVKQFDDARNSLNAILVRHLGYSAELSVNTAEGAPRSLHAALRIPAPELASALADLKSLGRVDSESQTGEEVTTQHTDLVARLKNSRETEQRLQAILRERTGKISDVLAVEQEIARVRGEIEQMEAGQKALEHRVDFAAVQLNLAEEYKAHLGSALPAIPTRLRNALVNGYREAVESLVGIGLFAAGYGPSLLLWIAVLFFPVRAGWRRWKRGIAAA
jgi:hypothetical protein